MILPQKDYSAGWMDVLINFATGLKISQTTLEGRTAFTPWGQGMGTCGMTWIAQLVINTHAKKVVINTKYIIFHYTKSNIMYSLKQTLKEARDTIIGWGGGGGEGGGRRKRRRR